MRRLISVIMLIFAALTMAQQAYAHSVNPKADSLAIAQKPAAPSSTQQESAV